MPAGNILVADDDAAIRTVLNQALTRAGYGVRATGNAATLWRWIEPGRGRPRHHRRDDAGRERASTCCRAIKKLRPELPVIVMSAQNTVMTAIRASEVGAYEYLPKPFDLKELHRPSSAARCAEPKERAAARGGGAGGRASR